MSKVEILNVKIDNLSLQEVLEKSDQFLNSKNQYYIVTPNPEFLVKARKDKNFKEILNYADIAIADGVGLVYAAKFLGKRLQRITGVDLLGYLCGMAEQDEHPIYLLGSGPGIAKKTAKELMQNFPELQIVGAESGGEISENGKHSSESNLIARIRTVKPKIIFIAFGHGKQEKWIFNNLDKMPSVKIAVGIGGTFDYISGEVSRAPEVVRNLGLEWLYRLFTEPKRWKRILDAVIIFPLLILKEKIFKRNS